MLTFTVPHLDTTNTRGGGVGSTALDSFSSATHILLLFTNAACIRRHTVHAHPSCHGSVTSGVVTIVGQQRV